MDSPILWLITVLILAPAVIASYRATVYLAEQRRKLQTAHTNAGKCDTETEEPVRENPLAQIGD